MNIKQVNEESNYYTSTLCFRHVLVACTWYAEVVFPAVLRLSTIPFPYVRAWHHVLILLGLAKWCFFDFWVDETHFLHSPYNPKLSFLISIMFMQTNKSAFQEELNVVHTLDDFSPFFGWLQSILRTTSEIYIVSCCFLVTPWKYGHHFKECTTLHH